MYLHIGTDVLLREKDVIAIIGRKGEKDKSRINRRFLKQKENEGKINNISNNTKAILSIKFYGLDHTPIQRSRNKIWQKCETIIETANNYIKHHNPTQLQVNSKISDCYVELVNLTKKTEPYTMVVKCFIKEKSKDKDNYPWLENINAVLQ